VILVDTSAFVEFLNRTGSAFDREIERLITEDADIAFADYCITEILQGIRDDSAYHEVKKSLLSFPALALQGTESYVSAANMYRKARKKGLTIRSTIDLFIAQIAIENNLPLLHKDRDFDTLADVCDLKLHRI
jgi:predicted nucleic acid-binding protein